MEEIITLEQFQEALNTLTKYCNQDFKKVHGNDRPCICCNNSISPIDTIPTRFPQSGMYKNGIVDKISAGYGSDFDGNMYIIAVCDECIKKLKEENKIQSAGNYMNLY